MRHSRFTALFALAFALPLHASDGSTTENENEWAVLDAELERMLDEDDSQRFNAPFEVSGFLRANYANSQNMMVGTQDLGGTSIDAARLEFSGLADQFKYFVSFDAFSGDAVLTDAYVVAPVVDGLTVTVGQFRAPFLRTALIDADKLLFIARTRSSTFFAIRDQSTRGVMFEASSGPVHFQVAAQNGADLVQEDYMLTGRAVWNIVGNDAGLVEGAYGASDELCASFGVSATLEQYDSVGITPMIERDEGLAIGVEAAVTQGPISFQAEAVDYERNYSLLGPGADGVMPVGDLRGGTTPYSATFSFMPVRDEIEFALRHEEFDDTADRALTSIGVNRYFGKGIMKLQVNFLHLESNNGDEDTIAVGVTAGF